MLADQKAKAITEARVPILMSIVIRSGRWFLRIGRTNGPRLPPKLFDRAKADAVSLPESTVDGTGLGHPHFGASNERRDIGWIRVAEADEFVGLARLVDNGSENPTSRERIGKLTQGPNTNCPAATPPSYSQ